MQQLIYFIEKSGERLSSKLLKNFIAAKTNSENLKSKINDTQQEQQTLHQELDELQLERARLIVQKAETTKVDRKLTTKKNKLESLKVDLVTFENMIPEFENALEDATENLKQELSAMKFQLHQEMLAKYEHVSHLWGRSLGERVLYHHEVEANSKSRVAICERCKEPIATFDADVLRLPIVGSMFQAYRNFENAFIPMADIEFFKCPRCNAKPFFQNDLILTSAGFYQVKGDLNEAHT